MLTRVLTYSDLRERSATKVTVDGVDIVVFKVDGKVFAVKNSCPHQRFQMLHEGEISDGAVVCPMHGWSFDIATGVSRTGQGTLKTYPVQISGNEVLIEFGA